MDGMQERFAPLPERDPAASATPHATSADKTEAWRPILPAPLPLPEVLRHRIHGTPSKAWHYRDAAGELLFVVARFDPADRKKEVLPFCCGASSWRWCGPPKPRPLYGLAALAARPEAPVLLVEGEKAADAAAVLFPDHVAVTWQGGSNATADAEWRPLAGRRVAVWPDNDAPGRKAAAQVVEAASAAGAAALAVVVVPADWPEGWDVADTLPEGVARDALAAMLAAAEPVAKDAMPEEADAAPRATAEAVRDLSRRAADMDGTEYAAQRAALGAELPSIGVTAVDKLRTEERKRRAAAAREAFAALNDTEAMEDAPHAAEPTPRGGARVRWPPGFSMRKAGLFLEREDSGTRIAGPFAVLGRARDAASNGWGLALEWADDDGTVHRELIPARLIHAEPGTLETRLNEGGLFVSPDPGDRLALRDALAGLKTTARVRRSTRCGWHAVPGQSAPVYLMPDGTTFGATAEPVVLDGAAPDLTNRCGTAGSLEEWQTEVAARAVSNPAAAFCIAAAFAGPLLELAGEPSGGFHLAGPSKIGKTTAAQIGVSVWGLPDKRGALRDWRSTANAMEAALEEASDGLLALDEISQADPRELEAAIYQAGNEGGKGRLRSDATARARRSWRVMILSTGELTPAQKAGEAGKGMRAGAEVRLPAVRFSADAVGMWPELHGMADRGTLWRALHEALRRCYGTAARAFLERLAAARAEGEADLREGIAAARRAFLATHLVVDATEQTRTVALRFAVVAAAGELAADMGVLPWPQGEATRAAAAGFAAWLAERGAATSSEDATAVQTVRAFLERHGEARFGLIDHDGDGGPYAAGSGWPIQNRAGWRIKPQKKSEAWRYLFLPETWRAEVCAGLDPQAAARALQRAGHLVSGDGRNLARREWVPSEGKQIRVYVVSGSIFE
jgi:uncharacterized protein (DUF927 family)